MSELNWEAPSGTSGVSSSATASGPRTHAISRRVPGWLERIARDRLFAELGSIRVGRVTVVDEFGSRSFGEPTTSFPFDVQVRLHTPDAVRDVVFGGSLGAAEAFIRGEWSCDNLTDLVRIMVVNESAQRRLDSGLSVLKEPLRRVLHFLHRNTRGQARKNIAAHYDLGNEFFKLFLDETLMYSAALFERPDSTLYEASVAKNDRICRKLDLRPTDHLLEIGTGWGGFALHAASKYGCRVTTTTISDAQHELAAERIRAAGLGDRITLLKTDYRDLTGRFDKLVSIEMIEAVGHQWFDTYFAKCSDLLKPEGLMVLQGITIADHRYAAYIRSVDFIQKYIFPGGCLPSVAAIGDSLARKTDLKIFHLEDMAPHYARTLAHWRENLARNRDRVRALDPKFDDEFFRLWEYYFRYCEGAFLERSCGSVQMVLAKPLCRRDPLLTV
jgi:cyclopropane-fatty-acyl-phospholipid synthase